jgi:phospholipid-binding lipoprotein MlaA
MIQKYLIGFFLIAALLLAASARAEEISGVDPGTPVQKQVSGSSEMTVRPEMAASEKDAVSETKQTPQDETPTPPRVAGTPETGAAPAAGEAPKSVTAPEPGTAPETGKPTDAEPAPEAEGAQKQETAPGAVAPPGTGTAPEETIPEEVVEETTIADPLEPWNRAMFQFNDKVYFWALKPVARGYNAVVPEPARVSVRNVFRNVKMPIRFASSLLQGKFKGAGVELARFVINSTIGLAGFFDVAKDTFELEASKEDLGQTLGFYGMGGLMYIVWPFIGPSNVRDSIGLAGDTFLDPINYLNPWEVPMGINAYDRINQTSLELGTYEDMIKSSLDVYLAVRDAYIQYRKAQIKK